MSRILLIVVLYFFANFCQADYIGAVVEHNPVNNSAPGLTIEENIRYYIYQIERARDVNIIVFPEYGLTGLVKDPKDYAIEIPEIGANYFSDYFLRRLSDAAVNYGIHLVVNLLEKSQNSKINSTLTDYYSTTVVFSDSGSILAKYRKINLYNDPPYLSRGENLSTFTTSFGTFGLISSTDLLHYHPSQTILENGTVTSVLCPTAWKSRIPFEMSLSAQVGYALANKVNLLTSNLNEPQDGIGGSGIYSKDGTVLRTILTDKTMTNFAYAHVTTSSNNFAKDFTLTGFDVLRNDTVVELGNYKNVSIYHSALYIHKALDLSGENVTQQVCHRSFCCSFNIVAFKNETNSSEVYKLVAFKGPSVDGVIPHVNFCGLVACLTSDVKSCGLRPQGAQFSTTFRQIRLWGQSHRNTNDFFRPVSLRGNIHPVYNVTYDESKTNESYGFSFNVSRPTNNLVVFGVYGASAANAVGTSLMFLAVLVLFQAFF